jgi:hypothetical protein
MEANELPAVYADKHRADIAAAILLLYVHWARANAHNSPCYLAMAIAVPAVANRDSALLQAKNRSLLCGAVLGLLCMCCNRVLHSRPWHAKHNCKSCS